MYSTRNQTHDLVACNAGAVLPSYLPSPKYYTLILDGSIVFWTDCSNICCHGLDSNVLVSVKGIGYVYVQNYACCLMWVCSEVAGHWGLHGEGYRSLLLSPPRFLLLGIYDMSGFHLSRSSAMPFLPWSPTPMD